MRLVNQERSKGKKVLFFEGCVNDLLVVYDDNTCSYIKYIDGYGLFKFANTWDDVEDYDHVAWEIEKAGLSTGDPKDNKSLAAELIRRTKYTDERQYLDYIISRAKFELGLDLRSAWGLDYDFIKEENRNNFTFEEIVEIMKGETLEYE